ncbi:MAG: thiamine phosphate synthase [Thermoguttaceae bacterium]|nr:thiamine phosphate synthase [Thermoguttaceae bacterium]MDW8038886.1 thiamine phosphate synthase [Thermoguttaceae bacterium]
MNLSVLRILDASANRTAEGLRVLEDYVRFVLDDPFLTQQIKNLRHRLAQALASIESFQLISARETQQDVGTGLTESTEAARQTAEEVLTANFHRVQQGLRSLEEWGKLLTADLAQTAKQLRYQVYTLQRAFRISQWSRQRLAQAQLYVLINGGATEEQFRQKVARLVAAGVSILQLRDKTLPDRQLLSRARLLRQLTQTTQTLCIINDRPDLALLAGADGVHLGQEDLSVKEARHVLGPDRIIGVSTHSIQQARQAVLDGANYIGVGPTFPSSTKEFSEFPGLELLRQVAQEIRLPAFAIGGITLENLPQVLQTGIRRVAVQAAIWDAPDPAKAAETFLALLRPYYPEPA